MPSHTTAPALHRRARIPHMWMVVEAFDGCDTAREGRPGCPSASIALVHSMLWDGGASHRVAGPATSFLVSRRFCTRPCLNIAGEGGACRPFIHSNADMVASHNMFCTAWAPKPKAPKTQRPKPAFIAEGSGNISCRKAATLREQEASNHPPS